MRPTKSGAAMAREEPSRGAIPEADLPPPGDIEAEAQTIYGHPSPVTMRMY